MNHERKTVSNDRLPSPLTGTHQEDQIFSAIQTELAVDSKTLLIAFGSMRLRYQTPPFEFTNTFKNVSAKVIFVRDLYQIWYQRGLPGIADNLEGTGSFLQDLIAQQPVERVLTFGGSMGGYAALYFGWYLGAKEVHAFAPKTFLSPLKRIFYGDFKWNKLHLNHPLNRKILQLQRESHIQKSNLDLLKILRDDKRNTKYYLYYSKQHKLDRLHCERMRNIKGIALRAYERGGHHILSDMKESGLLARIIQESLLPPD